MNRIAPKKSLGQNFLNDQNKIQKIIDQFDPQDGDVVIEIGPGPGALTTYLVEKNIKLTALELDKRAVELLDNKFSFDKYPNFEIINCDVLTFDIEKFVLDRLGENGKIKVLGNIPYNISSQIFFWLFDSAKYIDKACLTIQKEVAKRLVSSNNSKEYGILTLAMKFVGDAHIFLEIPPGCFFPKPKVTSSAIEMNFSQEPYSGKEFKNLMKLVRSAFSQRRKKLNNALKSHVPNLTSLDYKEVVTLAQDQNIDYFDKRAEQLTPEDFIKLYDFLNTLEK